MCFILRPLGSPPRTPVNKQSVPSTCGFRWDWKVAARLLGPPQRSDVSRAVVCQQSRFQTSESVPAQLETRIRVRSSKVCPWVHVSTFHHPVLLLSSTGAASCTSASLKGRSFLTLKDFNSDEIKRLLWVSGDLKRRIKRDNQVKYQTRTNFFVWVIYTNCLPFFYFSICLFCKESPLQWYLRRGAPEQECPQKQVFV